MRQRNATKLRTTTALGTCALALGLTLGMTQASAAGKMDTNAQAATGAEMESNTAGASANGKTDATVLTEPNPATLETPAESKAEATELLNGAITVANKMGEDEELTALLEQAKGVYIVPEYGKGALIVGGEGGAGTVLVKQADGWSNPAFYNFGSVSLGAQAGGEGGAVAFLLMTDEAVNAFKDEDGNTVALGADAGFTVVNYSKNAEASWGKADVISWSDTTGLFAGASVNVSDINWDDDSNEAYYGEDASMSGVLSGKVENADAAALKEALPH
tara:strand:- start:1466 stop:2293 length:828 start_codon:yes stop_codon:yes gene_type:complete